jgi:hypothetical protein
LENIMTVDINAAFPAPDRTSINPHSLEAYIQNILGDVAPDGGSWLVGRHVFWESQLNGLLFEPAVRAAIDAAAPIDDEAAADKRFEEIMTAHIGPAQPQGLKGKALELLDDVKATFGRTRTHN